MDQTTREGIYICRMHLPGFGLLAIALCAPIGAEIVPNLLDPKLPSFAEETELVDTLVPTANEVRGNRSSYARKARKVGKGVRGIPCMGGAPPKGKMAKADGPRLLQDGRVTLCADLREGVLKIRSRKSGSDSIVEWIPVRVSDAARTSLQSARFVYLEGETILELQVRESNDPSEGGVFEGRSMFLIDPLREHFLVRLSRSRRLEGSGDQGNFIETCEGVAEIRANRVVLGGFACQEEAIDEDESGEVTTYTRSTGPDPEFTYHFRSGLLVQVP